jgi:hypothetical protein
VEGQLVLETLPAAKHSWIWPVTPAEIILEPAGGRHLTRLGWRVRLACPEGVA